MAAPLVGMAILCALLVGQACSRARTPWRRFELLARASAGVVWAVDRKGRFTFVNGAVRDVYGRSPRSMLGHTLTEYAASEHADQDRCFVREALAARECVHHETVHLDGTGGRVRLALTAISHGRGAIGTAQDISHVRDLERRMVQTERMHHVGALAGGVAHDFKNLLTVVIAQAEIAKKEATPEVARRLSTILDTAERGRAMVEELLVFARKQNQRHEVLDIVAVVKGMEDMLRRLLRKGVGLETRLPHTPVRVRADRGKLEQILMNLVVNAQDASPDGSRIVVRVAAGELGIEKTKELGIEPGHWAVLQVIDHGEGMDKEVLSQVFEPFYTTKEEGKGTGLGLATVHGVAHQYGGTVAVRTVPGRGTRMSVLLPLVRGGGRTIADETTDSVKLPQGA